MNKKRLPIIKADKTKEFIEISNKKKLTDKDLNKCKESAKYFKMNLS